jgi:hypothetical protein
MFLTNEEQSGRWNPGHRGARVAAAVAVVCVVLMIRASTAPAYHSFGTRTFNFQKYGSSVSIRVPGANAAPVSNEFILHRAVVQDVFSETAGLVQVGIIRTGSEIQLDTCGTATQWTQYGEWKSTGTPNEVASYHCQYFSAAKPENIPVFDVWRVNNPSTNEWNVEINSERVATYKPSFGAAYPAIGGEIAGPNTPSLSGTSAVYGQTRGFHSWNEPGKGGEFEITNNANTGLYTPNGGWSVPPVPTPFTITH